MKVQGLELDFDYAKRVQPTEADEARAGLLNLLAEGKPYIFLVPESGEDEGGQYVVVSVNTDISEPEVLKAVLDTASYSLSQYLDK